MISKPYFSMIILCLILLGSLPLASHAKERHIAILIDTSSSMRNNDRARYTVQLTQIIAELLDVDDKLTVISMQDNDSCWGSSSMSLALRLNPKNYPSFKRQLDAKIQYNTGTYFATAIRTAIEVLSLKRHKRRMLLIIADSGGIDCANSWNNLAKLHNSGAMLAAINLGSNTGAFDANSAFDFTTAALDSAKLIKAVAEVYQKFLGTKQVQTGELKRNSRQKNIRVTINPFVNEAFLVVAADGSIPKLQQASGNPKATQINLNYRGGGETTGLDRRTRSYRIVRLKHPAAGNWRFQVPGLNDMAGWMLIQDSAVAVRFVSPPIVAKGITTPIEIELYDRSTGRRITDPSKLTDLHLTLKIDGQNVVFRDDGKQLDRKPKDGILTGGVKFNQTGHRQLDVHLETDLLDRHIILKTKVVDSTYILKPTTLSSTEVSQPVTLSVKLVPKGKKALLKFPKFIEVRHGNQLISKLRDNGKKRDKKARDLIYTGVWTPNTLGKIPLAYIPIGGSPVKPVSTTVKVIGRLKFSRPKSLQFGQMACASETERLLDLSATSIKGKFKVQLSSDYKTPGTTLEINLGNGWIPLNQQAQTLLFTKTSPKIWPVRIRAEACSEGSPPVIPAHITVEGIAPTGQLQKVKIPVEVQIIKAEWQLEVLTPKRTPVSTQVALSLKLIPDGPLAFLPIPKYIEAHTGSLVIPLYDNGKSGDQKANDYIYTAYWTPEIVAKEKMTYVVPVNNNTSPKSAWLDVIGILEFAKPLPVKLEPVSSKSQVNSIFDLSTSKVKGDFEIQVSSNYAKPGSTLEIDTGENNWIALDKDEEMVVLTLQEGTQTWPLRLRTGRCPEGSLAAEKFAIIIKAINPEGQAIQTTISLSVEILEEFWVNCWWPIIAITVGTILVWIVFYGIWSPHRFPSRLGVVLSPEEDINEGFCHPIHAQRGTGSGFYRNARVYICADFRLSGKSSGAIACLHAHGRQVSIQPVAGNTIWRQTADDNWDKLPQEETIARLGVIYKDNLSMLFFKISNG